MNLLDRMTPRVVAYAALGAAACWCVLRLVGDLGWRPPWGAPEAAIFMLEAIVAYGIALVMCVRIAAEYRHSTWLRIAWLCLAINAGWAMIRYALDNPLLNLIRPGYYESPWSGLARELPNAIGLVFLAVGIFAMARAFLRTGLGFTLVPRDWVAMAGVGIIAIVVICFRHSLSAARWGSMPLVLQAQVSVQILLAVTAAGCILLSRLSVQMGGGLLAAAMRCLTAHIVLRALLVLVSMVLFGFLGIDREHFVTMLLFQGAPWLFTLAAAYRYQLALNAARQAAEWRSRAELEGDSPARCSRSSAEHSRKERITVS